MIEGQGASLDLPIDGDLAVALAAAAGEAPAEGEGGGGEAPGLAMAITLRSLAPDQAVTVLWQEQVLANLVIGTGWERRTFTLPAKLAKVGDNRLRLHFRRRVEEGGRAVSAAVRTIEIGAHAVITAGPPLAAATPYTVETREPTRPTLALAAGAGLVYYVQPPRRARLRLDVRGRGALEVLASTDEDHRLGRPPTLLLEEPLRASQSRHEVDLSGYGGMPLRLG